MQKELVRMLEGRRGHFQMESGYHADAWYELGRLFQPPGRLRPFVIELARRLAGHEIDAVCGPMVGGAKLAGEVAAELEVAAVVTERHEDPAVMGLFPVRYVVPAGLREAVRGRRVAIVDDAISAGSAVRGSYTDLLACGAQPVVLGALVVFGMAAAKFAADHSLALEGLAQLDFSLWPPDECPLCRSGIPVEKVSDAQA